jgi:diadenosine tetraphosphate (Ap4A) HIT family hydrolase
VPARKKHNKGERGKMTTEKKEMPDRKCRFCDIISGKYLYEDVDEPIATSNEYVAIASVGALIEGWTLIVPKKHQLSMRNIYTRHDFSFFVHDIVRSLSLQYGPLFAFEHGSNKDGSITACGTDHAHLHIVPFSDSLIPKLRRTSMEWILSKPSEIAGISKNNEYLFYCEIESEKTWHDTVGYLHILKEPVSQFFRYMVAADLGLSDVSDYKRFPHLDTAIKTRLVLAGLI